MNIFSELRSYCILIMLICFASMLHASAVARKGITLAGPLTYFTQNNFANLQAVLNTNAGVIGVNIPWNASTSARPANPTNWNDPQYAASSNLQAVDQITEYVAQHGNGAIVLGITYGTPSWAACPGDTGDTSNYPAQNAADYGNYMYAMSERYNGTHVNNSKQNIGRIRDWVVYNEVNSPAWWKNTACNTNKYDLIYYYAGSLNQAYTAVHHVSGDRVLAGAFTSYDRKDYTGTPGLRISTDYTDWATNTANGDANNAWISPTDFVQALYNYGANFDAIALHPYAPTIYQNPLATPPTGAITLANISALTAQLRSLYPNGQNQQWHVAVTEYMQQSYYDPESDGWDHMSAVACPNYFCAQTTEVNLDSQLLQAYGASGSGQAGDTPYVDYVVWAMWQNVNPYVGGLLRQDGTDKNEGLGSGSVRAAFTSITP